MAGIQDYSTTAGSNTSVGGVSIAEGMNPAGVNNAIRAVMADLAAFVAAIGGAKTTGGAADVQTLTTGLSLSAYVNGFLLAFKAGYTNTGSATINVDGLGAKTFAKVDGSALSAGDITAGGIYLCAYESGAGKMVLLNPKPGTGGMLAATYDPQAVGGDAFARANHTGTQALSTIASSTSTALGVGSLEIGHASDTTLTRVSAGVAAIEGSNILLASGLGSVTQAYDADTLKADTADVLTAGFAVTAYSAGTKSSGTYTPDEANGNHQYATNGGAHTLAPPSNNCSLVVHYTNNGSAGAITTSGFTLVDGDAFTTTNTHEFICYITKVFDVSHLTVVALQ